MDLSNPFEIVVHYLLIGVMIVLSPWEKVSMVRALVCMVTHSTRPIVSHDFGY